MINAYVEVVFYRSKKLANVELYPFIENSPSYESKLLMNSFIKQ